MFAKGGPGNSGIEMVTVLASSFRSILGDGFDLVGFDPRGTMLLVFLNPMVFNSLPYRCWRDYASI